MASEDEREREWQREMKEIQEKQYAEEDERRKRYQANMQEVLGDCKAKMASIEARDDAKAKAEAEADGGEPGSNSDLDDVDSYDDRSYEARMLDVMKDIRKELRGLRWDLKKRKPHKKRASSKGTKREKK